MTGLLLVWLFRVSGVDEPLVQAAAVSNAPGWLVLVGYACLFLITIWPDAGAVTEADDTVDCGDLERDE